MLLEDAIRERVQRILDGVAEPLDVVALFADIRFNKKYPTAVLDLAHFPAHRASRNKGDTLNMSIQLLDNLKEYLSGKSESFSAQHSFTDRNIADALRAGLISDGIFQAHELTDIAPFIGPVALFGLTQMHGCRLKIKNNLLPLGIRAGHRDTLEIGITAPNPVDPDRTINLCVFSTSISITSAVGKLATNWPHSDVNATVEIFGGNLRYLGER